MYEGMRITLSLIFFDPLWDLAIKPRDYLVPNRWQTASDIYYLPSFPEQSCKSDKTHIIICKFEKINFNSPVLMRDSVFPSSFVSGHTSTLWHGWEKWRIECKGAGWARGRELTRRAYNSRLTRWVQRSKAWWVRDGILCNNWPCVPNWRVMQCEGGVLYDIKNF